MCVKLVFILLVKPEKPAKSNYKTQSRIHLGLTIYPRPPTVPATVHSKNGPRILQEILGSININPVGGQGNSCQFLVAGCYHHTVTS